MLLLTSNESFGETTKVTRVIDGDTFEIESGEKVRLIGINAPEVSDIFGKEAKLHLTSLIEDRVVELQIDEDSKDRDRYQRLLRYVILDGVDINKKMVSDGFAFAYLKYRFSRSSDYELTQIQSRKNNMGIWGESNEKIFIDDQKEQKTFLLKGVSAKMYFVGISIIVLLLFGFYYSFKK